MFETVGGGGGDSYLKRSGLVVVSGTNQGFLSHLRC